VLQLEQIVVMVFTRKKMLRDYQRTRSLNAAKDMAVDVKAVSPAAAGLRKSQEEHTHTFEEIMLIRDRSIQICGNFISACPASLNILYV